MFEIQLQPQVCFHNLSHTLFIVEKVQEIGAYYQLPKEEMEDLFFAGWFHDIGYWDGDPVEHEAQGAEMAAGFLKNFEHNPDRIERITSAILATKMPQRPRNLFEQILCDSDLYHLSTDQWYELTLLLKEERDVLIGDNLNLLEWLKISRDFVNSHQYHTDYAKNFLEPKKKANLAKLDVIIQNMTTSNSILD
jgi:predicted metal-dependent HD superfamily phosphohydrolase